MKKINVAITNDDGFRSVGIRTLFEKLDGLVNSVIIAPDTERSACSSQITTRNPLRIVKESNKCYSCSGTPADCIHIAYSNYLPFIPDMVVSGINIGENMGDDIIYSGTIAGAIEGRFFTKTAIAISLVGTNPTHYDTASIVAKKLVQKLMTRNNQQLKAINVNIPDLPIEQIKGYKITQFGKRKGPNKAIVTEDSRGNEIVWIGERTIGIPSTDGEDDFSAVANGYVSITPILMDFTDYASFNLAQELV